MMLQTYLENSARTHPDRTAIIDPTADLDISYSELDRLSDKVGRFLRQEGVGPGDRVGLCLKKSIDTVAAIFGILKVGAAYVPVGTSSPASRNAFVFDNCQVKLVFVEEGMAAELESSLSDSSIKIVALDRGASSQPLATFLSGTNETANPGQTPELESDTDSLAYILYTSGSTGKPKGVMLTHRNATSFVEWCSETFEPDEQDVFSSHAPFHFDLSILDLFLPIKHGASVVLIDESLGKNPAAMVELLHDRHLTVWYSTPSVLTLMIEHGKLDGKSIETLRYVLFAGEVFPVKHLRRLIDILPEPRYFNLYGPTETNVCTAHEVEGAVPPDRAKPYPIGKVCSHLQSRVVDEAGTDVDLGQEGELIIAGPSVLEGYWQLPELTSAVFIDDETGRWYRTGDLVIEDDDGVYTFVGRRDRMVKRRGFRIELGEIEAALYGHEEIGEVAVVAHSSDEGVTINAHYSTPSGETVSIIALKQFSAKNLPGYMVPDRFVHMESLPKTSTDKIDYQRLKEVG